MFFFLEKEGSRSTASARKARRRRSDLADRKERNILVRERKAFTSDGGEVQSDGRAGEVGESRPGGHSCGDKRRGRTKDRPLELRREKQESYCSIFNVAQEKRSGGSIAIF